jgi:hypothetical protein
MQEVMALDTEHYRLTPQGDHVLFPRLFAGEVLHFADVVPLEIAPVLATVLACVGCQTIDQLRACGS